MIIQLRVVLDNESQFLALSGGGGGGSKLPLPPTNGKEPKSNPCITGTTLSSGNYDKWSGFVSVFAFAFAYAFQFIVVSSYGWQKRPPLNSSSSFVCQFASIPSGGLFLSLSLSSSRREKQTRTLKLIIIQLECHALLAPQCMTMALPNGCCLSLATLFAACIKTPTGARAFDGLKRRQISVSFFAYDARRFLVCLCSLWNFLIRSTEVV